MPYSFVEVPETQWPRNLDKPIAVLRFEPDELETKRKISFLTLHDNLDYLQGAVIRTRSGKNFALIRHVNNQSPGIEVHISRSSNTLNYLKEFLKALKIRNSDLTWVHPQAKEETSSRKRAVSTSRKTLKEKHLEISKVLASRRTVAT